MKYKTIIRRAVDAIGHISGSFSSNESAARYNPVLAKWEQHYDARPGSHTHSRQPGTLNYFIQAV